MSHRKVTTPEAGKIFASPEKQFHRDLARLTPRLWRFAYGLCRNRAEADDLAQATCLRALEKAALFRRGSDLDRWLFTMCRRLWLNDLRAARVRVGQGIHVIDELDLAADNCDAEQIIFASEVLSKVMALPIAQREAVLLAYVEGFTYAKTAEILDIPVGTVMSRLSGARKRLAHLNKDTP